MKHAIKLTKIRLISAIVLLSVILLTPAQVCAAPGDETSNGQLSLVPAIEAISVTFSFDGDNNGNNQASLYYRPTGSGSWKPGIQMTADRRGTLVVYTEGSQTNPYRNQWRAIIFGLMPNTSYDVRVDFTDVDGGSSSVQSTIVTRNNNPASNGNTYYVSKSGSDNSGDGSQSSPWLTIQKAADNVSPGDRVRIMPGTYNEQVTITASGTINNYITFESYDTNNLAVVTHDVRSGTFYLNGADYIRLRNLAIRTTADDGQCVRISGNAIANIVEQCEIDSGTGDNWWCACIWLHGQGNGNSPSYTLIQNNHLSTQGVGHDGPFGVMMYYCDVGGTTIKGNTTSGYFWDGISTIPNFGLQTIGHFFIYDNTISSCISDCIEVEGGGMNVGIWNNRILNNENMLIAAAPCIVGPMYIFRNIMTGPDDGQAAFKLGSSSYGFLYVYHNTIYRVRNVSFSTYGSNALVDNIVIRNNIIHAGGGSCYIIEEGSSGLGEMDFDYNSMYSWRSDPIKWMGVLYSYEDWRASFSKEAHGVYGEESFVNADGNNFNLQSGSIGIDRGLLLPGFNDANSPWPYSANGPDMGAFEYTGVPAEDTTPPYTTGHIPPKYSTSAAPNTNIVVHIGDTGIGVDQSSIEMRVNGTLVSPTITGSPYNYTVTYNPPVDFAYDQTVNVTINASDLHSPPNVMTQESYSFTIQSEGSGGGDNQSPIAYNDPYATNIDTSLIITAPGVLGNDNDPDGDPLTVVPVSPASYGNLTLNSDGSFIYIPNAGYSGIDTFTYMANDGEANSNTATVSINVISNDGGTGGGGGAGGGGDTNVEITNVFNYVSSSGKFNVQVVAESPDNIVRITIPKDTVGTNSIGVRLTNIAIGKMITNLPPPPDDGVIVGSVYDITPDGANFDPAIGLTICYYDKDVPDDVAEKNLVIGNYDWDTGEWQTIPSSTNLADNEVTANLDHFSTYALLAFTSPANFEVMDISTPSVVTCGSNIEINATIVNSGDLTGEYEVCLMLDNEVCGREVITLDGGDSTKVTFNTVTEVDGLHRLSIGAFKTTFAAEVYEAPAEFITSNITVTPSEIFLGDKVKISTLISNIGDLSGTYETVLKMDNNFIDSKNVNIDGGDSEIIVFTITPETVGEHAISIGEKIVFFTVKSTEDVDEEIITMAKPEISRFDITPTYNPGTGKIESTRIDYQIRNSENLDTGAMLILKVFRNGELWEERELITATEPETELDAGYLSYVPSEGWSVGTYIFEAELQGQNGVVHSIQFEKFSLIEESITKAIGWGSLGIIIGGTLIVLLTVLAIVIYRRREMLRGYVE